jgi:hypothetical protein
MFAVIVNGWVADAWWAKTLQEAQIDNPGAKIIECTEETGQFVLGSKYERKI